MQPHVLLINTYYPQFLDSLYAEEANLAEKPFDVQHQFISKQAFGAGVAYVRGLRSAGCRVQEIICNADVMQRQWAREHDVCFSSHVHDMRREIVAAQVGHYRPDVLFVFEWCPLGDPFLADMKQEVNLVAGQIASPIPVNRTFGFYDVMFSSWPPIVDFFRKEGIRSEYQMLAFDEHILEGAAKPTPVYDVTFVGGFAPSHPDRMGWLETLLQDVDVDIFGYGIDETDEQSSIRAHHHGEVWGWGMYEVLQRSRMTLNRHACNDIRGQVSHDFANNMRLFEATGVGTCLLTEMRSNLAIMFEPDVEVATYTSPQECLEKIRYYLDHPIQRENLAKAGQMRTLRDHTYTLRMSELTDRLTHHLRLSGCEPSASALSSAAQHSS